MGFTSLVSGFVAAIILGGAGLGVVADDPESGSGTMNAIRLHAHGDNADVVVYEQAPIPVAGPGQVLIRVHAAGVVPGDWKTRNGRFGDLTEYMPFVLGYDVSGVIESVGDDVDRFKPGDEVFGYLPSGGSFAQYVVGPAKVLAIKPANVTHEEAAGAPVSALAAWYAITKRAELKNGQTILIQAGAGGVGHYAVQIAHDLGAKVYTTASPRNHEFLRSLGADTVIDYRTERFEDVVGQVDVVFDMIGGDVLERSYGVVKPGGYLVAITSKPDAEKLEQLGIRGSFLSTPSDADALAQIADLMESGRIKTHISKVFDLSDAAQALALNEEGHTRGKIVIRVR